MANLLQSVVLFTKKGGPPYAMVSNPFLVLAKTVHARRHRRPAARHEQKAQLVAVAAGALVDRVIELTLTKPRGEARRWAGRGCGGRRARRKGSGRRGFQPHPVQRKLFLDSAFAAMLASMTIAGPKLERSADQKSQISASSLS